MPRRPRLQIDDEQVRLLVERLCETGPHAPALQEQFDLVRLARERSAESSATVDRALLLEIDDLRQGLHEARRHQAELRRLHEQLTSPPWFVAVFLRQVETDAGKAIVAYQGVPRVVTLADDVAGEWLSAGDEVLLSHDLNIAVGRVSPAVTRASDVAEFQDLFGDGRLLLKAREAEVVATAAGSLDAGALVPGDRVRWDPVTAIVHERLPRSAASHLFLAETPTESFADIGGLDREIARLQRSVRMHLQHADVVRRYGLRRASSVLLVGPPGTGKTLMARALARWLGEQARSGRARFMHIKPAALHSMWYSQSEANYREAFRVARDTGAREPDVPVVMFFDEVEAIGMARGGAALARVDDRVLTSFMAELDGLEARGNILVVAATNRPDALDPALVRPGRLGDLVLEIPRPTQAAARAILERHLPASVPFGPGEPLEARREIVDVAASRLYAPNAEGDVASVMFRDGSRRTVQARDLVNGAMLANVARLALEQACAREIETGQAGVRTADVLDVISEQVANAVAVLTPANCHAHLDGLPQDLAVVRVEPVVRRVRRPHRFLQVA
jgi:proteasome-associated ATPase